MVLVTADDAGATLPDGVIAAGIETMETGEALDDRGPRGTTKDEAWGAAEPSLGPGGWEAVL